MPCFFVHKNGKIPQSKDMVKKEKTVLNTQDVQTEERERKVPVRNEITHLGVIK